MRTITFLVAVATAVAGFPQQPTPTFHSEVSVVRVLTEVRVVTRRGEPIPNLGRDDFIATIDGAPAAVEDVRWVSTSQPAPATAPPAAAASGPSPPAVEIPAPEPQLYVVLVQVGFHHSRLTGLVRVANQARELIRDLPSGDRVAVAVFDSHLTLAADFGAARDDVVALVNAHDLLGAEPVAAPGPAPSLAAHLDAARAADATNLSQGLEVLAAGLRPLAGAKTVILLGWGIGRFTPSGVRLGADYPRAVEALAEARATVFALDITDADYHSLEVGLMAVADHTGGTYSKTNLFPKLAVTRLARILSGHYELSLVPPGPLPDGAVEVEVAVAIPDATVLTRPFHLTHETITTTNAG